MILLPGCDLLFIRWIDFQTLIPEWSHLGRNEHIGNRRDTELFEINVCLCVSILK